MTAINSQASGHPTGATPAPISDLCFILAMSVRLRAVFAEVRQSATLLVERTRRHIAELTAVAAGVRAIDDELEREFPLFVELFQNDPPAKRRRALAILRGVHAGTEQSAAALTPRIPPHLLTD